MYFGWSKENNHWYKEINFNSEIIEQFISDFKSAFEDQISGTEFHNCGFAKAETEEDDVLDQQK